MAWNDEFEAIRKRNERIFSEWLQDYAKRTGKSVSQARAEVIEQRARTAEHCNEVYRREVGITTSKEDEMAKNATAQTTIDMNDAINESKEDTTMTENAAANTAANEKETIVFDVPRKPNGKYDFVTDKAKHAAIREETKLGRTKGVELTHAIEGKKLMGGLTNDPEELELLAKAAKKFGWSGRVLTFTQASDYLGTPNPEYTGTGWLVKNKPYTNKEGRTTQFMTIVYPVEAFIFDTEDGEPALDEQKALEDAAKKAKRVARKANKNLRDANDAAGIPNRRKTSRKATGKKAEVVKDNPVPAAAPAKLIHVKLANGIEFDARDAKEAAELKALFE